MQLVGRSVKLEHAHVFADFETLHDGGILFSCLATSYLLESFMTFNTLLKLAAKHQRVANCCNNLNLEFVSILPLSLLSNVLLFGAL